MGHNPKKSVRILLVGERRVGKTSLILSLVSEEFPEGVPPKSEEITIPADVTPEKVPTNIVDYSASEDTEDDLIHEIQRAHVVCVVYSVDDEESLDRITTKWLPFIRDNIEEGTTKPVMLVCNKVDLVDYSSIETMISIMEEFPEVDSCVECSAKGMRNISELFYYAQKSVLHPSLPLYIMSQKELTPQCKKALTRIFKICDTDADCILNDSELNAFQRRCFNAPLQPEVLEDVKGVIQRNIASGISRNGITLDGFIFLHKLFIERGRNETTWTVLRKFGYDDHLNLSKEYLVPPLTIPNDCSAELSHKGQQYFVTIFDRHDRDRDGALCPAEVDDLFATCPTPAWGEEIFKIVPTSKKKWMSRRGFLCFWTLTTLFNTRQTLEYLGYFGYPAAEYESQTTAIHITREQRIDWAKRQTSRNVYQCLVVGGKSVGKSMLCSGLIGEPFSQSEPMCTINMVLIYGQEKYLVLRDVDVNSKEAESDLVCDVLCLLFDVTQPDSFQDIAHYYLENYSGSKVPVLVVASKADLPAVRQNFKLTPEEFCTKYKLPPPSFSSIPFNTYKEVYVKLATMAAFPRFQPAWVMFYRNQARNLQELGILPLDMPPMWWKAGVGLAAATAVGYLLVKALKPDLSIR